MDANYAGLKVFAFGGCAAWVIVLVIHLYGCAVVEDHGKGKSPVTEPVTEQSAPLPAEQPPPPPAPFEDLRGRFSGATWSFCVADYDNDGVPDLWVIKKTGTGTGRLELHILSGKDPNSWLLHTKTALHECRDETPVPVLPEKKE